MSFFSAAPIPSSRAITTATDSCIPWCIPVDIQMTYYSRPDCSVNSENGRDSFLRKLVFGVCEWCGCATPWEGRRRHFFAPSKLTETHIVIICRYIL